MYNDFLQSGLALLPTTALFAPTTAISNGLPQCVKLDLFSGVG